MLKKIMVIIIVSSISLQIVAIDKETDSKESLTIAYYNNNAHMWIAQS